MYRLAVSLGLYVLSLESDTGPCCSLPYLDDDDREEDGRTDADADADERAIERTARTDRPQSEPEQPKVSESGGLADVRVRTGGRTPESEQTRGGDIKAVVRPPPIPLFARSFGRSLEGTRAGA